jgi:hypothetical protein
MKFRLAGRTAMAEFYAPATVAFFVSSVSLNQAAMVVA